MRPLQYLRPESRDEVCHLLAEHGEEARILAGGQSLLNMMKLRIASPRTLVDAHRVSELRGIEQAAPGLTFGSMATYAEVRKAVASDGGYAAVADAIELIADMHVRHMGTVGGACCHADPFADMPNIALAFSAQFEARSQGQRRIIPADEFFVGPLETGLTAQELLCSIHLPSLPMRCGSAYEKFSWRRGDYAIVSIATLIALDDAGQCDRAVIVAGALGQGPVRLTEAEEALVVGKCSIEDAAALAAVTCAPESDRIYGSAQYKSFLVRELTTRALRRAFERAWRHSEEEMPA